MTNLIGSAVALTILYDYFGSRGDNLLALANVMHEEYEAIVEPDLVPQIDVPQLSPPWVEMKTSAIAQVCVRADGRLEVLKDALRGILSNRVRSQT